MDRFIKLLERKFLPLAEFLSNNKYLLALRDGLILSMPLMIIGSLTLVFAEFPLQAFQNLMVNVFGESWNYWAWDVVYPSTIGLVTLFATFGVAYSLSKTYDEEPLPAGVLAVVAYFILIHQLETGGFNPNDFGAEGLFTGMISAIIVTEIYVKVIKANIVIRLPKSVPPSISRSFVALVPAAIITVLFLLIRYVFSLTQYTSVNQFILKVLQLPLLGVGTSLIGTEITAGFFNTFFWIFGIHGTVIVQSVMQPIWEAAKYVNLEAYKAGLSIPYIVTTEYLDHFVFLGGSGITLPLCIMMAFRSKSKQLKQLGRLALVPSIFNINEPIIFGLPIVMNPIMFIPFFIAPMISILISYLAMAWNIVSKPTGIAIPFTTPAFLGGFLITNDVKVAILQGVILIITALLYYPFFKIWDNKCYKDEQGI